MNDTLTIYFNSEKSCDRSTLLFHIARILNGSYIPVEITSDFNIRITDLPDIPEPGYYHTLYVFDDKILTKKIKASSYLHAQQMCEYPMEIVTHIEEDNLSEFFIEDIL
jgi:hypothetical protein